MPVQPTVEDLSIIALKQADGRYILRRWSEHQGMLLVIPGHDGRYLEPDLHRQLDGLRLTGKTYIHRPDGYERVP